MRLILNEKNMEGFMARSRYLNIRTGIVSFFPKEVPNSAEYLEVPNMQPYLRSVYLKRLPYTQEDLRAYNIDENEQFPKWIFSGDQELVRHGDLFESRCHCLFEEVDLFPNNKDANIENWFWKFAKEELPGLIREWCQERNIEITTANP